MRSFLAVLMFIVLFLVTASLNVTVAQSQPTPTAPSRATGQIAFISNRTGHYEIYVMNADGSSVRQLTNDASDDGYYGLTWSPDGKHIVFASSRVAEKYPQLFIMDADGANSTLLCAEDSSYPSYSPDGRHIAFVGFDGDNIEIESMDADGTNIVNLTHSKGKNLGPSWSPDGKHIVFDSNRDTEVSNAEIYVMNPDGTDQERLTI